MAEDQQLGEISVAGLSAVTFASNMTRRKAVANLKERTHDS